MKRILVADDDNNIRLMLQKVLKKAGYDVELASNGKEALQIMLTTNIDFCIIDYYMPYMTGLELIEKMKEWNSLKDIPFILLSATDKLDTINKAMEVGVQWYMRKGDLDISTISSYIKTITTLGYV